MSGAARRIGVPAGATGTVWVYALTTPRPGLPRLEGIGGEPLRLLAAAGLAAVIGRPARSPRAGPAAWLRYAAIVERLARRRAAILPVRYGTRLGVEDVRTLLVARGAALRTTLAALRHRVQMNVHVATDAELPADDATAPAPPGAATDPPTRGRQYLQARAARAAREAFVPGFDPVRAAVRRWVRDERLERREGRTTVFHLIPRAGADAYRRTIERVAGEHGVHVTVTGPWAPYAFAEGLSP